MTEPILQVANFSKHFRSHWTFRPIEAVKNISFEVYRGELFGFLGHNGAGKTTTIKSLLGLLHKTNGRFFFHGKELHEASQRRIMGYLPEMPYFYEHLSIFESLEFFARLFGFDAQSCRRLANEKLELVGLADRAKAPVRSLSKGLQQRLGFAQAIINDPEFLFLDEPFSGLDPIGRFEFRQLIEALNRQGTTIFLSSHILSDVEELCSRVAIMVRGELKQVFQLADIPKLFGERYEVVLRAEAQQQEVLQALTAQITESKSQTLLDGSKRETLLCNTYDEATTLIREALSASLHLDQFRSRGLRLEEIFVEVTGFNK